MDIFRQPNESLPKYHIRQQEEVTNMWTALSFEERSRMTDHMLKVCPALCPCLALSIDVCIGMRPVRLLRC